MMGREIKQERKRKREREREQNNWQSTIRRNDKHTEMSKDRKIGITYTRTGQLRMNGNMAGWPGVGTEEQMIKEIEMKLKRTEAMLETFDLV